MRRFRWRALGLITGVVLAAGGGAVALASGGGALAAGTGASGAGGTVAARRTLTLIRRNPATVRGAGFRARRPVRVTLVAGHGYVRRPLANRQGRFTVAFPTAVDRCTGWTVTAVQRGASAVVVRGPRPECAPASTP